MVSLKIMASPKNFLIQWSAARLLWRENSQIKPNDLQKLSSDDLGYIMFLDVTNITIGHRSWFISYKADFQVNGYFGSLYYT